MPLPSGSVVNILPYLALYIDEVCVYVFIFWYLNIYSSMAGFSYGMQA